MERKTAIALGTFDGVHKGHLAVLDLPRDAYKVAVTFNLPPRLCILGEKEIIMTAEEKIAKLKKIGIDEIYAMDFDNVKDMPPQNFLEFIKEKYNPKIISCGFNYRFGKGGEGNTGTLHEFCLKNGIDFRCASPVKENGETVSSSLIRNLLKEGNIKKATELLGEPFSFEAEVIHGDSRGRTIGFPTVNQKYPDDLVKVKFGVYKTKISFDGKDYLGITNIGTRPTFQSDFVICETYIKNFSGDLYGKTLRLTPIQFLREEKKFGSIEELKEQIEKDLKW